MKFQLTVLLILFTFLGYSQSDPNQETPKWAELMYQEMESSTPNFQKVINLYEKYYTQYSFKKNTHTWHYKMWLRNPESHLQNIDLYHQSQETLRDAYVKNRKTFATNTKAGTIWKPIGPIQNHDWDGNVLDRITHVASITSAPSDPNIMFCGTEAGEVYKSIDGGSSWNCVSLGPELVMSVWDGVTAMAIHPTNPDIVYVAGENQFYKSTDGGLNWSNLSGASGKTYRMFIHPTQPNIILWATTNGLYRSTNGGTNITQIMNSRCYDLDIHPTQPDSMYIVLRNDNTINPEFYVSNDAGASWNIKTNGWYSSAATDRKLNGASIAVSPSDPNIIYTFLLGDSTASDDGLIGIYKSIDGGDSWTIPVGHCGDPYTATHINYSRWSEAFLCELVVGPTNPNELIVGTASCYKSVDGGLTFTGIGGYSGGSIFGIHADIRDIYQDANHTWIATDGGINRSSDFFTSNSDKMSYGLHGQDFWGFDIGWHDNVIIGGLFHNGVTAYYKNYPNRFFVNVAGGEPSTGYINPSNSRLAYYYNTGALLPDSVGQAPTSMVYRPLKPYEMHWPAYSSRITFHPNSYQTFYQGTENKFWKTTNGGASFSLVKDFYTPTADSVLNVAEIQISSSDPDVMYVARAKYPVFNLPPQLWKTTDGGLTWTQLNLPTSVNGSRAMITIDPTNHQNIWLGFASGLAYMASVQNNMNANKVYQSTDGGLTWTNLSNPILNGETCHDIIHVAGTDGGVYFCSQNSVYYKNNSLPNWVQENTDLPFYISTNIGKVWYKEGKLRIGTYGRGVWENDLYEPMNAPIARIMVDQFEKSTVLTTCLATTIDSFYFDDHSFLSYSDTATNTWSWQFPTGSPSSSTLRNPAVSFNTFGTHIAILTVTDINGLSDSDTLLVETKGLPVTSLIQEGFETGIPDAIQIENYDIAETWKISASGGYNLSNNSILMDNYSYNKPGEYDEFNFYFNNNTTSPWLQFDVAYSPYSTTLGDSLEVLVSTDCGLTFQSVYLKEPSILATVPIGTTYPTATSWRTDSIDLSTYLGTNELMVVFRNINGYGNRLYIDNINIGSQTIVAVTPKTEEQKSFTIFPNPTEAGCALNYTSSLSDPFKFILFDSKGKQASYQEVKQGSIYVPKDIPQGIYFYMVEYETHIFKGKLIVR